MQSRRRSFSPRSQPHSWRSGRLIQRPAFPNSPTASRTWTGLRRAPPTAIRICPASGNSKETVGRVHRRPGCDRRFGTWRRCRSSHWRLGHHGAPSWTASTARRGASALVRAHPASANFSTSAQRSRAASRSRRGLRRCGKNARTITTKTIPMRTVCPWVSRSCTCIRSRGRSSRRLD